MQNPFFTKNPRFSPIDPTAIVEAMRLEMGTLQECMDSNKHAKEIRKDIQDTAKAMIRGTGTFMLGFSGSDPTKVNAVEMLCGFHSYNHFEQVIDKLLVSKEHLQP